MKFAYSIIALALVAVSFAFPRGSSAGDAALHVKPCVQGHAKVAALCGTFNVYEDRVSRKGRIIPIRFVVIPATHPAHRAIAVIAGGPGQGVVDLAGPVADSRGSSPLFALHDRYDLLFMDDRGMGASNPFGCDFMPVGDPASYFKQLWPDALVTRCRTRNEKTHDLALYDTNNTVDDLNDLRAALGYPKLVLDGGSYGTFFALVYMRRHPDSVESAVLDSVAAPGFVPLPGSPEGAQQSLNDLVAKCRADRVCNAHFPDFSQHFQALVSKFDGGPVPIAFTNPKTKRSGTVMLSKEVFVDRFREALYFPEIASYVPYVVERWHHGDSVPLGRMISDVTQFFGWQTQDLGANLSYTCAEFIPFLSPQEIQAEASASFTGDLRVRAQRRACSIWNVPPMPADFNQPVRSDAPVLMISASDDPATPPRNATEALAYLPNGKQIIVRGAGHSTGNACTDRLTVAFVRAQSAKALAVSQCSAAFKFPPFATSMKDWNN